MENLTGVAAVNRETRIGQTVKSARTKDVRTRQEQLDEREHECPEAEKEKSLGGKVTPWEREQQR